MDRLLRHEEEELLFKGKNIHCRKNPIFEGLGDSLVYSGYFKKAEDSKEEIVVRKIKVTNCCEQWNDIFIKHTREKDFIKHENVLKIIGYEEKDEWRFFALERYDATLEQFCKGFYRGPMPSDAQVLCQIAKGVLYLHKVHCSHGNLTPRTILIASSQPVRMMIKLSEFGLSKFSDQCDDSLAELHDQDEHTFHTAAKRLKYFDNFKDLVEEQDICQRKYWILDGTTTDSNQQTPTPNEDVFSAGCVCFYFLKRGVHPFGYDSSILENIKKRNPVNLKVIQQEKDVWEFAYEPIKKMMGDPPTDGTNWLMIAKDRFMKALPLRFEKKKENELGRGGFGVVYKGTYEGNAVAVKVRPEVHSDDEKKHEQKREMEEHLRLDHENVLKLLHVDDLRDQTYLVLELCAGTLTQCLAEEYSGPELPPDGLVLYQIANGLHYIHSQKLVHRDVKPDNILISITKPVQMKLSDFGFVKKTSPKGTFTQSGLKGTEKWMAPEILELLSDDSVTEYPNGTIQSDTFAAGCVFFYFLTRGKHPFGKSIQILVNILNNNPIELNQYNQNLQSDDCALYELIGKMIKPKEERISLPEVNKELTTKLHASRQFKKFVRSVSKWGDFVCRFHPTEQVLACSDDKVMLLFADNSSIPFSNWKEKETQLQTGHFERFKTIEWNLDGTQLAAIADTGRDVIVWSFPSCIILFQKTNLNERMDQIKWNPFRPNVFATFGNEVRSEKIVFLFNSCPVEQQQSHFDTIKSGRGISSVQWISANRVALGLREYGRIEIWEVDESTTSAKIVKQFKLTRYQEDTIEDLAWDERTKCLAACSSRGRIQIWSMDSDRIIHAIQRKDVTCFKLAWRPNREQTDGEGVLDADRKSADNFILACGFVGGQIVIWTPLAKKMIFLSHHSSNWVDSLSFSPDGRFLASADDDGKLIIWTTKNWKSLYIGKEKRSVGPFSWMSSSFTDVPDYKLTFNSNGDKVCVVEYAVDQCEKPSQD